jgi:hypothetical protein
MTILAIMIFMILYTYKSLASDPLRWRRLMFEAKMLWMGTKGNYEDAIMRAYNHVCKSHYVMLNI